MQQFINGICEFIESIYTAVATFFLNKGQASYDIYSNWRTKNVFTENSLIGFNLTWAELIRFVSVYVVLIILIVLFVRFIFKIMGIFRFNRLND